MRMPPAIDIDTMLIHGGVVAAPSLRDTLRWWHGTWAGQVPFFRPLSSYAFWLDWKLFGSREPRYLLLSIVLHLIAVWQFVRLSFTLFHFFRVPKPGFTALLSGLFFVDGLYSLSVRQETNTAVFAHWKNLPESLVTMFFCLSLNAYVKRILNQETDSSHVAMKKPPLMAMLHGGAPLVWYLACCGSKEAGILMPLILIPLELPYLMHPGEQRGRAIRRLAPLLLALPLFVIVRRAFLGTATGFVYGSNGSWVGRMTDNLVGAAGHDVRTGRTVPLFLGLSLTAAIYLFALALQSQKPEREKCLIKSAAIAVVLPLALSMFVNTSVSPGLRPAVFIMQAVDSGTGAEVTGIAVMLVGLISLFLYRPLLGLFGYTWVAFTLVLLALTPSSIHREYLVDGGFAIMISAGWTTLMFLTIEAHREDAGIEGKAPELTSEAHDFAKGQCPS